MKFNTKCFVKKRLKWQKKKSTAIIRVDCYRVDRGFKIGMYEISVKFKSAIENLFQVKEIKVI